MIQIIGFLICACLAVKLLEMSGNPVLQNEDGKPRAPIAIALLLGWLSVIGFALWLFMQGQAFPDVSSATAAVEDPPLTQAELDCIDRAQTAEEMNACPK